MGGLFRRRRQKTVDAGMTDARFWDVLQSSSLPEALHAQLATLGDGDLLDFERRHAELHAEAYDWGLWGAAYVLHGGCSDDTFVDFRAYLLSLGRDVYESARADPDSLAYVSLDAAGETWEDWTSPTMHVIHQRTGQWAFAGSPPTSPLHPTGEEWQEDSDELARRFPRLTAAYA